jgi:tetratricopeptide (TPR) repeat protein
MTVENGSVTSSNKREGDTLSSETHTSSWSPQSAGGIWLADSWRDLLLLVFTPVGLVGAVLVIQGAETAAWMKNAAAVRGLLARVDLASLYLMVLTFVAVGRQLPALVRVYGHREVQRRYRARLIVAPLVLLAVAISCVYLRLEALTAVLLLWGIWHATMQTYGIMRIYDSKVSSLAASTIWLDYLIAVCWFGAGVLFSSHRMEQLMTVFYACGLPLISPVVMPLVQLLWGGLTVVVTTAFVVNYVAQRRQNQRLSLMKLAVMVSSFGLWWFSMVSTQDALLGVLLYEVLRAVQNLLLVRVTLKRAATAGDALAPWARVFGRPGWLGVLLMLGAAGLYGLPFFLARVTPVTGAEGVGTDLVHRAVYVLMATSTMLHFYFEGFTWRLREDWVRASLAVPAPVSAPAATARTVRLPHVVKWALFIVPLAALGWSQSQRGATVDGVPANLAEVIPQSARVRASYGAWLLRQGRPNDASDELRKALEIQPTLATALIDLGQAQLAIGNADFAIEQLEKAVECAPQSAAAEAALGKALFFTGDSESALRHLTDAVDLAPDDALFNLYLGRVQAELRRPEEALASFDQAIALDPSLAEAYNARGMIHMELTHFDEAIDDFDQAIQLDAQLFKAYRNRARVWQRRNQPEQALTDLTTLIAVNAASLNYVMRGDIFYSLKQYDKARDDYVAAMQIDARDPTPITRLVALYLDKAYANPALAIEYANRACQQTSWRDFRALAMLAASYAAAGNQAQAAHWQEEAIKIVPPSVPEHIKAELRSQVEKYRGGESKPPTPGAPETPPAPAAPPPGK